MLTGALCDIPHIAGLEGSRGLSKAEIEELRDLDTAHLDQKILTALKYVEHLAVNKGKVLEPKFLHDVQELYTDGEVRYMENGWAFANGTNWISNKLSTALHKLRIVSRLELDPAKSTEHRGIA